MLTDIVGIPIVDLPLYQNFDLIGCNKS